MKSDSIILIGMAGVGKSTIGKLLSEKIGFGFLDADSYITEKEGMSSTEIIESKGENAYMEIERRRVFEIKLNKIVLAPGGSIVYHPDLMEYLKKGSLLVYLRDSFENIERKLKTRQKSMKCIVGLKDKSLKEVFEGRTVLYEKCSDMIIDVENKTPQGIVKEIVFKMNNII